MRALSVLLILICTALACTHARKTVPIRGWSVAGRHAGSVYKVVQELRAEGYTQFALPEPTILPWFVVGELVASKEPLERVKWNGFKVASKD